MKMSGCRRVMCFLPLLLVACATARGGSEPLQAHAGDRIEDFFSLPLSEGPSGFDRLARALEQQFPASAHASAIERTAQQAPVTLRDGYIVQRYLRLENGRHLMAEFAKTPCMPVQLAVSLTRPDPAQLDYYRRTGVYLAAGNGMSVTFSVDTVSTQCVTSIEIAETPTLRADDQPPRN
ncbi:hypothetical protein [Lysobacter sp. Hz 25]|uniref:hypothetical protein n=1 Tax=Lysobacter sp. Hz 25 TaxID=3383698 RepID=UPI0038D4B5F9